MTGVQVTEMQVRVDPGVGSVESRRAAQATERTGEDRQGSSIYDRAKRANDLSDCDWTRRADHCGDARACEGGCDARMYDWGSALYPPRSCTGDASHGGGGTGAPFALCGADDPWGGGGII